MPSLREFCFTIMDMVYQSRLLMVKFGFSIRYFITLKFCRAILLISPLDFSPILTGVLVKSYTQYIPLPISDLDSWLKTPSIYVFDCSAAGMIVNAFIEVFNSAFPVKCLIF